MAKGERTWVDLRRDGDGFFYSDDGVTWTEASGSEGNDLHYVEVGRLETCGG